MHYCHFQFLKELKFTRKVASRNSGILVTEETCPPKQSSDVTTTKLLIWQNGYSSLPLKGILHTQSPTLFQKSLSLNNARYQICLVIMTCVLYLMLLKLSVLSWRSHMFLQCPIDHNRIIPRDSTIVKLKLLFLKFSASYLHRSFLQHLNYAQCTAIHYSSNIILLNMSTLNPICNGFSFVKSVRIQLHSCKMLKSRLIITSIQLFRVTGQGLISIRSATIVFVTIMGYCQVSSVES